MTTDGFVVGQQVTYVPRHAAGNASHPDAERGVVSSINDTYVFVRFGTDPRGQACRPEDLIHG